MSIATILSLLLQMVPEAIAAFEKIKGTLSETDQAVLDAEMAAGDAAVTADHAALLVLS